MRFWESIGLVARSNKLWWFFPALVGATAYGDIVSIGKYAPYEYLILNAVEIFLIFVGINIGYWICFNQFKDETLLRGGGS